MLKYNPVLPNPKRRVINTSQDLAPDPAVSIGSLKRALVFMMILVKLIVIIIPQESNLRGGFRDVRDVSQVSVG